MNNNINRLGDVIHTIIAEIHDVREDIIGDAKALEEILVDSIKEAGLTPFGDVIITEYPKTKQFPKGYQLYQPIGESHVLIANYVDQKKLAVDIASCTGLKPAYLVLRHILDNVSVDPDNPKYKATSVSLDSFDYNSPI